MGRPRRFVLLLAAAAAAVAVAIVRHGRGGTGHRVPGGILIGHAGAYDTISRLLLGSLFGPIVTDVAVAAPTARRCWR
jgi:hypothetical protein